MHFLKKLQASMFQLLDVFTHKA